MPSTSPKVYPDSSWKTPGAMVTALSVASGRSVTMGAEPVSWAEASNGKTRQPSIARVEVTTAAVVLRRPANECSSR